LNEKFDVVVALFHVISYQTSNQDIRSALTNVKRHLKKDGIFIFDFWYGPAVLSERPETRSKTFEDADMIIKRLAQPVLKINENVVDVNYKISFEEKQTGKTGSAAETHSMRYFFIPEIRMLLENAKLTPDHFSEWMTGKELTDKSWSAIAVAINN
jgi:SAM-dependent methyltransferase